MRIIYFDIDCLRPDHLGCYGYDRPTSPAIDRIAAEGLRFNHYYCASSPCLPSRAGLVSGRFGIHNGIVSNHGAGAVLNVEMESGRPKESNQMFPRQLKAHGYDPVCFSNFADRHYAMWFMNGWSEFHTPNLKRGKETAEEVNARVLPWLQSNAKRQNYYLHINYWDAHRVYKTDHAWTERFRDSPVRQTWPDSEAIQAHRKLTGPFTASAQFPGGISTVPLMPGNIDNRQDFEKLVTAYDASIAYVDHHIRQVLDELEHQKLLDETVIIVSGDHGDAFGEHGIYSDHTCTDECIHRIPLIIRWPGLTYPDTSSNAFMYNIDFPPTICDLLDIPVPAAWDGKSYKQNMNNGSGEDREFLVWDSGLYTVQRAVRSKTHLYIRTYDPGEYTHWQAEELYNIAEDPYQTRNLAAEDPETVRKHQQIMDDWVARQMRINNLKSDPLQEVLRERTRQNS